jgi:hypothetical protein
MLPKKYRNIGRKLHVRRSKAGLGLFSEESIERKEFVVEYRGPVLSRREADIKGGKYLFETSRDRVIDGSHRINTARYINHSCRANCEIEVLKGRVLIFSKRKISAGEELTYDYGKEYFDEYIKPFGCRCEKCKVKK